MKVEEIQPRIDAVNEIASSKGLREVSVGFRIDAHKEPSVYAHWYGGTSGHDYKSWSSSQGEPEAVMKQAEEWANALPSIDERRLAEFTEHLAKTIEMGNAHGIDVQFVNPLTEAMKRLSENAITHQK